jgi:hypothetical protein
MAYFSGFIFDPKTKDFVDLDFNATAGYYDPPTGTLYLVIDGDIVAFSEGLFNRILKYFSKRFRFPYTSFGAIKALAHSYPINVIITYPDIPFAISVSVVSIKPQRLPKFLVDACEVYSYGSTEITVIYLASVLGELPI